jgi:hypothetical protein
MHILLFATCQSATIQDGRVDAMGLFNTVTAEKFPATLTLNAVVWVSPDPGEAGSYVFRIRRTCADASVFEHIEKRKWTAQVHHDTHALAEMLPVQFVVYEPEIAHLQLVRNDEVIATFDLEVRQKE